MKILEGKVKELVYRTLEEFKLPKSAGEGISFCILAQWYNHGHFNWFAVSSKRAWLLTDPNPAATTLCLKRCLDIIERSPANYFESSKRAILPDPHDQIKKGHNEDIPRVTDTIEQIQATVSIVDDAANTD